MNLSRCMYAELRMRRGVCGGADGNKIASLIHGTQGARNRRITINENHNRSIRTALKPQKSVDVISLLNENASGGHGQLSHACNGLNAPRAAYNCYPPNSRARIAWDVLKRFVGKMALGVSYEVYRNLIVSRMRGDGFTPGGMKAVVDAILMANPLLFANPHRLPDISSAVLIIYLE
jgi:hypothetical protein